MTASNIGPSKGVDRNGDPLFEHTGFRMSWGAIFAGLIVATAIQIVLGILGIAVGFGAYDLGDSLQGYGIGAAIWVIVSTLIALFVGGRTTGRLAGIVTRGDGILHGIVLWGVSTIFAAWLATNSIGAIAGGTLSLAGNVVGATASGVAQGAAQLGGAAMSNGNIDFGALQQQVTSILNETGNPALSTDSLAATANRMQNQATTQGLSNDQLAQRIVDNIQQRAGTVDRQDVVNVLAARTDLSQQQAANVADRVTSATNQLQARAGRMMDTLSERAGDVVNTTTDYAASSAWLVLLGLGLSVGAAAWGSATTARE